jgi:hypothetical protein
METREIGYQADFIKLTLYKIMKNIQYQGHSPPSTHLILPLEDAARHVPDLSVGVIRRQEPPGAPEQGELRHLQTGDRRFIEPGGLGAEGWGGWGGLDPFVAGGHCRLIQPGAWRGR